MDDDPKNINQEDVLKEIEFVDKKDYQRFDPLGELEAGDPDKEKRKPMIRTMQSDIREYVKGDKKKFLSMISEAVDKEPGRFSGEARGPVVFQKSKKSLIFIAIGVLAAVLGGLFTAGYFGYLNSIPYLSEIAKLLPLPASQTGGGSAVTSPVPSFIHSESSGKITIREDGSDFGQKLREHSLKGNLKNGVNAVEIIIASNTPRTASLQDFFKISGAKPSENLLFISVDKVQSFIYRVPDRINAGFIFEITDTNRALAEMIQWEPRLYSELKPIFMEREVSSVPFGFEDKIYKNIPYRFSQTYSDQDFGLGYFIFPAKKYAVVTTSEEAIKSIINRLFEM